MDKLLAVKYDLAINELKLYRFVRRMEEKKYGLYSAAKRLDSILKGIPTNNSKRSYLATCFTRFCYSYLSEHIEKGTSFVDDFNLMISRKFKNDAVKVFFDAAIKALSTEQRIDSMVNLSMYDAGGKVAVYFWKRITEYLSDYWKQDTYSKYQEAWHRLTRPKSIAVCTGSLGTVLVENLERNSSLITKLMN